MGKVQLLKRAKSWVKGQLVFLSHIEEAPCSGPSWKAIGAIQVKIIQIMEKNRRATPTTLHYPYKLMLPRLRKNEGHLHKLHGEVQSF